MLFRQGTRKISLEEIYERHSPLEHFRISEFHYPTETEFAGSSRKGWMYVLSGQCEFCSADEKIVLADGDWAELVSDAPYRLRVIGDSEAHLVRVWSLPEAFRQSGHK